MSGVALPYEPAGREAAAQRLARVRAHGGVRASFHARGGRTFVRDLSERDGYRMRFPRADGGLQGVIINTGGGMAGGDRVAIELAAGAGADAAVTTPSAERVYRALAGSATELNVTLEVESGARLAWLPQETILYDGARLQRRLNVDIAQDARLLMIEMLVLGRAAHGEAIASGAVRDQWRVRRAGRLVLAENLSLEGEIADALARPAVGDGARVLATALYVAGDAEDRLTAVRAALQAQGCRVGASAWDGMLVVRGLSREAGSLRRAMAGLLPMLAGRDAPRVWQV